MRRKPRVSCGLAGTPVRAPRVRNGESETKCDWVSKRCFPPYHQLQDEYTSSAPRLYACAAPGDAPGSAGFRLSFASRRSVKIVSNYAKFEMLTRVCSHCAKVAKMDADAEETLWREAKGRLRGHGHRIGGSLHLA